MPLTDTVQKQKQTKLPDGFLMGAGSSAHQCEGNNTNSDWWHWEQIGKLPNSGLAADHYNRYEEDFRLAAQLGLKAIRISVEWSRIEPVEGKFDAKEMEHYRKVLMTAKSLGGDTASLYIAYVAC
jgi:beta-glucosidase